MANEGFPFVIGALFAAVVLWGVWFYVPNLWSFLGGILGTLLIIFFAYFFRDPLRVIPVGDGLLLSPADGKIVGIKELESHPWLQSPAIQISIFLSPLDVHINRIPCAGTIEFVNYKKGKFLAAFNPKASEANEQTEIGLTTDNGTKIVFKQIAGILARRIVCHLENEQKVAGGEKFGMIKFGSRTDLIVPSGTQIDIRLGQRVKGGETILGRMSNSSNSNPTSTRSVEKPSHTSTPLSMTENGFGS